MSKFKIAVTGDIHYPSSPTKLSEMISNIKNEHPDVLAIIGDVAEVRIKLELFPQCLQEFRSEIECPILVLPGNHDLWIDEFSQTWTSLDLMNEILPKLTREQGCYWLETETWVKDGIAVVGSYLHYDYSAKDKVGVVSTLPDEWFERNKRAIGMNDAYMQGLLGDKPFANQLGAAFRERLRIAQEDPAIRKIIVLSHVPCMEQQMTRRPHNFNWAVSTPYFGNLSHQKFIEEQLKVTKVVSGHSHIGSNNTIETHGRSLQIINIDSHYDRPKFVVVEIDNV